MVAAYLAVAYLLTGVVVVAVGAAISRDVRRCLAETWWLVAALVVAWPLAFTSRWRR